MSGSSWAPGWLWLWWSRLGRAAQLGGGVCERGQSVSVGALDNRWLVVAIVVLAGVMVGCDSSAGLVATTVEVWPVVTTVEPTTTAAASPRAAPPTTPAPTTTEATAPPTTSVEDQVLDAITRAQTAMRNCYRAAPGCDQVELENALVGVQLQGFIDRSEGGNVYSNVDALTWSIVDGPTLKGEVLAVATVCSFDPIVTTRPDGTVNDDQVAALQEWQLIPVGRTWKLAQIINQNEAPTQDEACGA